MTTHNTLHQMFTMVPVISSADFDTLVEDNFGVPFATHIPYKKKGRLTHVIVDIAMGAELANALDSVERWKNLADEGPFVVGSPEWKTVVGDTYDPIYVIPSLSVMARLLSDEGIPIPQSFLISMNW